MSRRELTPRHIVEELDKYVIGQNQAKKCVAIALRNRWRRQHVKGDLREEIMPNNIVMTGAFHASKPSDLIPELQGRFPIRVELQSLTREDFLRILVEPKNALIKQYRALRKTEKVDVTFTDDETREIAAVASKVNETTENIGARRLHTVMTRFLEDILFEVPNIKQKRIEITAEFVQQKLKGIVEDVDLTRYIL